VCRCDRKQATKGVPKGIGGNLNGETNQLKVA